MKHIKVADDVHKQLMDDRNAKNVSASDVIRALYDKTNSDIDPDDDGNSWQETYRRNGVEPI